jgi:hypothetical protein
MEPSVPDGRKRPFHPASAAGHCTGLCRQRRLLAAYHFLLPPPAPLRPGGPGQRGGGSPARLRRPGGQGRDPGGLDDAARAGKGLNRAVQRLARECGCVILVSDAVVAGAEDLTPETCGSSSMPRIERLILALRPKVGLQAYAAWSGPRSGAIRSPGAPSPWSPSPALSSATSTGCASPSPRACPGSLVLVEKTPPAPGSLQRGDLVAWRWPGGLIYPEGAVFLKVVKGLPGTR